MISKSSNLASIAETLAVENRMLEGFVRELERAATEFVEESAVKEEVMLDWLKRSLAENLRLDVEVKHAPPGYGKYLHIRLLWRAPESVIMGLGDDTVLLAEDSVHIGDD